MVLTAPLDLPALSPRFISPLYDMKKDSHGDCPGQQLSMRTHPLTWLPFFKGVPHQRKILPVNC